MRPPGRKVGLCRSGEPIDRWPAFRPGAAGAGAERAAARGPAGPGRPEPHPGLLPRLLPGLPAELPTGLSVGLPTGLPAGLRYPRAGGGADHLAPGDGALQRLAEQVLARLPADRAGRDRVHGHLGELVGGEPPGIGDLERLVRLPPAGAAPGRRGLQDRVQLAHRHQDGPAGQLVRRLVEVGDGLEPGVLEEVQELVRAGGVARAADRPGGLDDDRGVAGAAVQDQTAGDAEDGGLAGCGGLRGGGRRGARDGGARDGARGTDTAGAGASTCAWLMLRTAPTSCSSETGTTWEGMQRAWAKARTAVSSPTNSTVLVGSWSESPGVRQEVHS